MPVDPEDLIQDNLRPVKEALQKHGLSLDYLVRKHKEELEATDNKKGPVWPIRQRARQDAHRLRGDYPAEKLEHSGSLTVEIVNYAEDKEEKPET